MLTIYMDGPWVSQCQPEILTGWIILKNYWKHHQIHQPDTSWRSTLSIPRPSIPNTMITRWLRNRWQWAKTWCPHINRSWLRILNWVPHPSTVKNWYQTWCQNSDMSYITEICSSTDNWAWRLSKSTKFSPSIRPPGWLHTSWRTPNSGQPPRTTSRRIFSS